MNITAYLKLLALASTLTLTACGGGEDSPDDGGNNGGGGEQTSQDSDNDGVLDSSDNCANTANSDQADFDNDGSGDACDADDDNDGVNDGEDWAPLNPIHQSDNDGDGVGNGEDFDDNDSSEQFDSDGDGVGDNADAFPNNSDEQYDTDGDGVGDNSDPDPNDGNVTFDSDGDGVADQFDWAPNDPNEQSDSDNDGVGDNADWAPFDDSEQYDNDGDNVGNNTDCAPEDSTKSEDANNNGTCDVDETVLSFNLSGAVSIVTTDSTATQTTESPNGKPAVMSKDGRKLNQFVFHENKSKEGKVSKASRVNDLVAAGYSPNKAKQMVEEGAASNFFVIDDNGDLQFAADSDFNMKVSYSVIWDEVSYVEEPDPIVEGATVTTEVRTPYLFFAIDSEDIGQSYDFIKAAEGCAIFKVNTETAEWSCVEKGVVATHIDEDYRKTMSDQKRKPLQIDDNGNVLFIARALIEQDWDGDGNVDWYDLDGEKQSLRKVAKDEEAGRDLTPDNFWVESFMSMPNDTVTYIAYDRLANGQRELKLVKNVSNFGVEGATVETITLSDNVPWGDFFYAKDDANTMIYSDSQNWGAGIQFTQPLIGSRGRFNLELDTAIFSDSDWNVSPKRIILADDGSMFGLFVEERWTGETSIFTGKLKRMLPYSPATFASFRIGNNWTDYWQFFDNGQRDVQVSKGFAYYIEQDTHGIFGERSVIRAVRLVDGQRTNLLDDSEWNDSYEIYNWKLSGDKLYFTGFDQNKSLSISGRLDTKLMKQGAAVEDYLVITETSSVLGASNKIDDLEVLRGSASDTFTGGNPKVTKYFTDQENLYSASVEFNKYMDTQSVNESTTVSYAVVDEEAGTESFTSIEADGNNDGTQDGVVLKVWLNKTLHLIFDTDIWSDDVNTGSLNTATQPLDTSTKYRVEINGEALDNEGFALVSGESDLDWEWTTRPTSGWYKGIAGAVSGVTDGQVGKFAINNETGVNRSEVSLASVGYPLNHKVEFSIPSSAPFVTKLFLRESHRVDWDAYWSRPQESIPTDGSGNEYIRYTGFQVNTENSLVYTRDNINDEVWEATYGWNKEIAYATPYIADTETGITYLDTANEVTYTYVPWHDKDLEGNVYIFRWDETNERQTVKLLGTDPANPDVNGAVYYEQPGHYIDVDSGVQYFWNFGAYRDSELNEPDWDTQELQWVDWTWVNEETGETRQIQTQGFSGYWVDSEGNKLGFELDWSDDWQWDYYAADLNDDGMIDISGLCQFGGDNDNCGQQFGSEAGEYEGFNAEAMGAWTTNFIYQASDFIESNDEWSWFMYAEHGGWGWSTDEYRIRGLDSTNPDWYSHDWNGETLVENGWSQREWMRFEYVFVTDTNGTDATDDDITTVTLNAYDSDGDIVSTRTKELFMLVREASWQFWNAEGGYDDNGFTLDLSLEGGDAVIDNIRVTDMSGEVESVLVEETFSESLNIFSGGTGTQQEASVSEVAKPQLKYYLK